jgi:hypothetical protein
MNRIFAHFDNYQPVYIFGFALFGIIVGVLGYSLGPISSGYAHFGGK